MDLTRAESVLRGDTRWALLRGDCRTILPKLSGPVAHMIADPPYSGRVQANLRSGAKEGASWRPDTRSRACAAVQVAFGPLDRKTRLIVSREAARLVARWSLVFADPDGAWRWRRALLDAGLSYARTGAWVRLNPTPQFSGDRPAAGYDAIAIAHQKPGRKKWNGGGTAAVWSYAVAINRGQAETRLVTTEKPLALLLELVRLFTDPDDVVLDPFAGAGTVGVACLHLGRRYLGIERDARIAELARQRLNDAARGTTRTARQARQEPLFGTVP